MMTYHIIFSIWWFCGKHHVNTGIEWEVLSTVFPFSATLYFLSTTFWKETMYILLHYIYLIIKLSYFADCMLIQSQSFTNLINLF